VNNIGVHSMYEDEIMKPTKNCLKMGGAGKIRNKKEL
jgi:hypothetical protein